MSCVVDASSVVPYLLGDASAAERDGILSGAHAPALVDVEVTHTLRGLLRASAVAPSTAEIAREALAALGVRRHPDARLLRRAWELRDACTTYDGLYVALAEALDAPLLTRDARLARGIGRLVDVVVTP
ncbi:type II toxin-antitoxin system VapC family toxin [Patulibacter sp. S7RM1-6]